MKTITKTALGLLSASLVANTASAVSMSDEAKKQASEPIPVIVKTIDADGRVGELTIYATETDEQQSNVLGALEQQTTEAYIVRDNEGDLHINHVIDLDELPDPTLNVETVETYTYEYRGMTFTNKVTNIEG